MGVWPKLKLDLGGCKGLLLGTIARGGLFRKVQHGLRFQVDMDVAPGHPLERLRMLAAQIHVKSLRGQTAGASFALGFAHYILFCSKVAQLAGGGIEIPLHAVGFQLDVAERIDIESLRVAFQIDPRNAIVARRARCLALSDTARRFPSVTSTGPVNVTCPPSLS